VTEVHLARDLSDAIDVLHAKGGTAIPVAGGTDLVLDRRLGRVDAAWLVDLSRLDELRGVEWSGDAVTIGAMTRIRALELDPDLAQRTSAIVDAARVLGSVQVRTMATLGGNLAHATPSAEMVPALLVHGAEVDISGPAGARSTALSDLFVGPGRTTLSSAELITRVRAHGDPAGASCYLRQTVRWAMDLAGVGAAAMVRVEDGAIAEARVAIGAVAPVPLLVPEAAAAVVGAPLSAERAREAGELASEASRPISDARGPAEYRRAVVRVLVARALSFAWRRANGDWSGPVPQHGIVGAANEAGHES
jgi:carbon-monoxide dehydrogenase medium subunit